MLDGVASALLLFYSLSVLAAFIAGVVLSQWLGGLL